MAWQSAGSMMGNGAPGGNVEGAGNGNQPQGTEYTLQGMIIHDVAQKNS